jgi:predicted nuclease of predicted toxin-antitoxin system
MKFLLDQSTDARIITFLAKLGHDTTRIGADYPGGIPDEQVLAIANNEGRILITDDRDFGELVIRSGLAHAGVIYLRLGNYADLEAKQERLRYVLTHYADKLDQFLVVTPHRVRLHRPKGI